MNFNSFKFIDLFCGIGGFHQALSSFGLECVFASDIDKHAKKTYQTNYNIIPHDDIRLIQESIIPDHNILCAGFPCQSFSISGKQKGLKDDRGILFHEIIRIARFHKPEILLLENVKNLLSHDNGRTFQIIKNSIEEIGYNLNFKILNTSNFGLPHKRERIYIVCFRNNIDSSNFYFPNGKNNIVSLKSIIEPNPQLVKTISFDKFIPSSNYKKESAINKPIRIGHFNKGGQGERVYSALGHSITLSASGGGIGSRTGLYLINNSIRKLTTRECARLQGFPENFKIISSTAQAEKQFGNSVSVNVLKSILQNIKTTIFHE